MRKNFYLSGLFLCILALCVCGCGGGSAADPMGTATVQFVDGSGSVITTASAVPNGTITLRAQVTNLQSDGTATPVVNEKVSFSLVNTGNGASLLVVNDRTGSGGLATVLYTAGNTMYSDIVRVTTEGSGSTATIHINKTGGTTDARIDTLTASSETVAAGQTSIITANVTDGASNPVMGEIVRFSLPVNESGASFSNAYSDGNFYAYTDASGNAVAIYTAGSNSSLTAVYDTVQAELENGSSKAVSITRSAETPGEPLSIAVVAEPNSVSAGQVSIVTATLTGDDNSGVTVTFSLPVNNSGASLSASSAVTDGSGNAVVTYTAGPNNPTVTVDDTVRAAAGSISDSVAITRTGSAASSYSIAVTASPTTLTAKTSSSVVTAKLTATGTGTVSNRTVTFTATRGTLSVSSATTDGSGNAVTTFTGDGGATGAGVVAASITIDGNTYSNSVAIDIP